MTILPAHSTAREENIVAAFNLLDKTGPFHGAQRAVERPNSRAAPSRCDGPALAPDCFGTKQ